jgi:AcrR family transcriptional regulator
MKTTRKYVQRARAEATAETRERILAAVGALSEERYTLEIVLADVAERAGVTVQTVLRHFGSRDGLFDATRQYRLAQVLQDRAAPVGDVAAAVAAIASFYEKGGDWMLVMITREHADAATGRLVARGRVVHRDWVREVFAPQLARSADPGALTDLLVVATDLYTWKLLRRDAGLDPRTTQERMLRLARAVLPANPEEE